MNGPDLAFGPEDINREPVALAADTPDNDDPVAEAEAEASASSPPPARSISTDLVTMALERYTLGVTDEGDAFVVPLDGPAIAQQLRGGRLALRPALAAAYFELTGRVANQAALADALTVLEGRALQEVPTELHLRVARKDGWAYLDLGEPSGRAVRVSAHSWDIVPEAPLTFRRTELTGVLPEPDPDGCLGDLWALLNVADDDRPLVLAWMLCCLLGDIPCPILVLNGEQGTGKSSAARIIVLSLDPSAAPLRRVTHSEDSWPLVAQSSWVIALDNVSTIRPGLSDTLCRAVTGDGDVRRRLYSDGALVSFNYRRPILLNGIGFGELRGDLAERVVAVELMRIGGDRRVPESQLSEQFTSAQPRILGALLTLLSQVIAELPRIRLDSLPRMADFAEVLAAIDIVLGVRGLDRYLEQVDRRAAESAGGDPVARALRMELDGTFTGTASQLLAFTEIYRPDGVAGQGWPVRAQGMSDYLRRHAPAWRAAGWQVDEGYHPGKKVKQWTLTPPGANGDRATSDEENDDE